ncbi:MAG: hypothetical protein IID46_04840 [Planctomycetes bacterium]|nr:hypothetical protein [Planctomycetota bacterium]
MNSKFQMASVSLVGAIPGLALSIVLVMALVTYFGDMSIMMTTLASLTLLVSVGLAMLPIVIMVFGSKTVKDESEVDEKQSDAATEEEEKEEVAADDDDEEEFDLDEDTADESNVLSEDDFDEPDGEAEDVFMEGDEDEFDMSLFEDDEKK